VHQVQVVVSGIPAQARNRAIPMENSPFEWIPIYFNALKAARWQQPGFCLEHKEGKL
jgi:hypothetical protein